MIARDLANGRTLLIRQEDHADLAAQFALHWGNATFAPPGRRTSVISGTAQHDGHFREIERILPIDVAAGRPFGHRKIPSSATSLHLKALEANVEWVEEQDPYAALLVSMHHTGLAQNRYNVIESWRSDQHRASPKPPPRGETAEVVKRLEAAQEVKKERLGLASSAEARLLRYNYHLLQVFDLMSLHLCVDGYDDQKLREVKLGPVPLSPDSSETASLQLMPIDEASIRVDPYPFDQDKIEVSVMAREAKLRPNESESACRDEYVQSERRCQNWTVLR